MPKNNRQRPLIEQNETNNYTKATSSITVSDPVTLYYAERANNVGFTSPLNSGWTTQRAWTFTGLVSGQTNWYRVKAGQGPETNRVVSEWSNVESSIQDNGYIRLGNFNIVEGTGSTFTFDAIAGCQYRIRYSQDVSQPLAAWPYLTPPADGWRTAVSNDPLWIMDTGATNSPRRFYRLEVK